ncbi:hypothetical protein AVDCRST_MAG84-4706 [uncultured Microcoleus sp.]|uniref:Uncharacterized protein n=1 Tax=uncultured Microcoleus sp. TaxID=259945 RepID=A0A6J4N5V7_9CYAN|nr:hypothetical protein AVDCRST_MAG84-4706 [uncultured Microcoleus sp.]
MSRAHSNRGADDWEQRELKEAINKKYLTIRVALLITSVEPKVCEIYT